MLKLMKYEVQRRKQAVIIFMLIVAVVQSIIVFGFYKGGGWILFSSIALVLLTISVYLFVLFDGIRTYYSDLNSNEGYMLFMTPNTGYRILATKLLISFAELLLFVLAAVALLILDYFAIKVFLIDTASPEVREMLTAIADAFRAFIPSVGNIFVFSFTTILQWFNIIVMATVAITLTKTVLSNVKYSWLISLGFFIGINIALQFLSMAVISAFGFFRDMMELAKMQIEPGQIPPINSIIFKYTGVMTVLYVVYISAFYSVSGWLLDRRIDI